MPAGRHATPGICEEDRRHAKYITQIWGRGTIWESLLRDFGDVVRVETCGSSGWITSRKASI